MTNHPIHMHGYDFEVTCTDGGWVPESARWPEVTIDVPVGAMRAYRVRRRRAGRLGDPLPQVAPHHERDGPRRADLHRRRQDATSRERSASSCPTTCRWARRGMAEMGEMEMPMPDNTLPMMTGFGQFGPMEMGGMFSVVKVREGLARDDYDDPGWYKHPRRHGRLRGRERRGGRAGAQAGQAARARPRPNSTSSSPAPSGRHNTAALKGDNDNESHDDDCSCCRRLRSSLHSSRLRRGPGATADHGHDAASRPASRAIRRSPRASSQVTMREGDGKMVYRAGPRRGEARRADPLRAQERRRARARIRARDARTTISSTRS